ncbi:MAG: GHKL domain-containing protein [Proteobacteria bacterium]|nr:GHKL domain-containing protein [Pseudomonadota bacterium]MBU1612024.1 GHKL domain-containing protein [Pseudomonadota bacterium]
MDDFELTILIDQTEVFRSGTDAPVVEDIVSRKSFSIAGRNFTVICQPLMMGSFQSVSQNNRNHFYHGIGSSTFAALSLLLMVILIHRNQIQKFHLKEKQMELISQWDLMTDLFEGVPIGMTLWEADGSLSMANACFMSMIGYSLEEVDTLEKWHHLAHPDPEYRDQVLKEWQEDRGVPAETKDLCKIPSVRERQVTCKDGSIKIIEFRAAFFANNTALVALTDITKRKVTEMAREELISELERFTYTVSHDLKSPIITIKGFLGKLAHDIENENRESIQKDIERIDIAATRMNHLLDELLNLSRIGRLGLTLEEVNLDEAVAEVIETLHSQVSEADGSIRVEGQLPTVMAISVRIREVFQNIIENSLKFTRQGVAPEIEIGSRLESGKTVFYVKDNGIGIDPRYHDKIFNLFEQLEPDKRGTGIGLTVVKRIIKHHNGSIWVESDGESAGSTFYFTLS